jgi:hypothetical protein
VSGWLFLSHSSNGCPAFTLQVSEGVPMKKILYVLTVLVLFAAWVFSIGTVVSP